jgi:hypothetical protein
MHELYARNATQADGVPRSGAGGLGTAPGHPARDQAPRTRAGCLYFLGQRGQTPGRRRPSVVRGREPFRPAPRPMPALDHDSNLVIPLRKATLC